MMNRMRSRAGERLDSYSVDDGGLKAFTQTLIFHVISRNVTLVSSRKSSCRRTVRCMLVNVSRVSTTTSLQDATRQLLLTNFSSSTLAKT